MDSKNIVLFADLFLKENESVDEYRLQKFIYERPEVSKLLPLEEIRDALDNAYVDGHFNSVFMTAEKRVFIIGEKQ